MYEISSIDGLKRINFAKVPLRKEYFKTKLNEWIDENQNNPLRKTPIKLKITKKTTTPSPVKRKLLDLKNDTSKFKFKEKSETSRLSLLERIKLKEQLKKEEEPKDDYEALLLDKIPMIYDTIYHLQDQNKPISINKLIQIIQDSSNLPIHESEINDVMKLLQSKCSKFKIVETNSLRVLKVTNLNRDQDLKLLKS
ncbi:unnamed protein product [Candida verbasci]|uniref:DNA replication factor Cdt1 C-terminal domain-containing protein n=1 Tax=Candida verbasci TaxID=1227364 RepID=A0A9W4TW69_9ASCO|nr:unnamed protein product [Candida verbasci]